MKRGIDVSEHNGLIDWSKVTNEVDFVMIRAGYGRNNIDAMAKKNMAGAIKQVIPFGMYWFSYALNEEMARKEADYACDLADMFKPELPIAYDWEYDSDSYAKKCGVNITKSAREKFARAFLNRVKERGYKPMIYTNYDYLTKGFSSVAKDFDLWLARWDAVTAGRECAMWQKTNKFKVSGISTLVDGDCLYKEYKTEQNDDEIISNVLPTINNDFWHKYTDVAKDIIEGKYGNGEERKKKLNEKGYDYDIAQKFVNYILLG